MNRKVAITVLVALAVQGTTLYAQKPEFEPHLKLSNGRLAIGLYRFEQREGAETQKEVFQYVMKRANLRIDALPIEDVHKNRLRFAAKGTTWRFLKSVATWERKCKQDGLKGWRNNEGDGVDIIVAARAAPFFRRSLVDRLAQKILKDQQLKSFQNRLTRAPSLPVI